MELDDWDRTGHLRTFLKDGSLYAFEVWPDQKLAVS